ncbi:hypothetical protein BDQ17DRAFT_756267 [Cyathus striatus]|nr:hypothetical protein BDQ17DRAFT_756267 [Cyathus striatus]
MPRPIALFSVPFIIGAHLALANVSDVGQVSLCTDYDLNGDCIAFDVVFDECVNLQGGLAFLNSQLSSVVIQNTMTCTFFSNLDCVSNDDSDHLDLGSGSWNLNTFNDQAVAFQCDGQ